MTALRLYNTLTRTKEDFAPLDPKNVRMYVCGPTVYDFAHIGNARPAIVFDVLFRLLQYLAKNGVWDEGRGETKVTYVRNITDIDDKINARALERRGDSDIPLLDVVRELTKETYRVYDEDIHALRCLRPTFTPRATEHIKQMIAMVETLIANGHAYEAHGHVLFNVESKVDYGKLSHRPLDEMIAGARVDVAPYKKNPTDFVLWKPSHGQTPGWESPWGRGRPGWHLECSAMIQATFGGVDTIDIHGGGIDLVFPHHENEIAQSEGAHHNHPLAQVWMHNGFLNVEGEKMSKSLGNFVTIRDLYKTKKFGQRRWSRDVLRFTMLQTHYRQPIDWTVSALEQSNSRLDKWKRFAAERTSASLNRSFYNAFFDELADDLNLPKAFALIDSVVSAPSDEQRDRYTVYKLIEFLGFKAPRSDYAKLADDVERLAKVILGVSKNDRLSLVENVLLNPLLKSGGLKTSTRLLANVSVLDHAIRGLLSDVQPTLHLEYIRDLVSQHLASLSHSSNKQARIETLIEARNAARKAKDFKESDRIRDELLAQGIVLKDGPQGTTWEVKR